MSPKSTQQPDWRRQQQHQQQQYSFSDPSQSDPQLQYQAQTQHDPMASSSYPDPSSSSNRAPVFQFGSESAAAQPFAPHAYQASQAQAHPNAYPLPQQHLAQPLPSGLTAPPQVPIYPTGYQPPPPTDSRYYPTETTRMYPTPAHFRAQPRPGSHHPSMPQTQPQPFYPSVDDSGYHQNDPYSATQQPSQSYPHQPTSSLAPPLSQPSSRPGSASSLSYNTGPVTGATYDGYHSGGPEYGGPVSAQYAPSSTGTTLTPQASQPTALSGRASHVVSQSQFTPGDHLGQSTPPIRQGGVPYQPALPPSATITTNTAVAAQTPAKSNLPSSQASSSSTSAATAVPGRSYKQATQGSTKPRKRKQMDTPSDSEDGDNDYGEEPTAPGGAHGQTRLPGACTNCRKVKMRCLFSKSSDRCDKCLQSNKRCVVEGRKPRSKTSKREYFLEQLKEKDAVIETLLKQLHDPYTSTPLAIAAFKRAATAKDQANAEVIRWLDRMQQSTLKPDAPYSTELPDPSTPGTAPTEASGPGLTTSGSTALESDAIQTMPDALVPISLFAGMSLGDDNGRSKGKEQERQASPALVVTEAEGGEGEEEDEPVGIARDDYFELGPSYDLTKRERLIEMDNPPELLVHGLLTPEDVSEIFKIYFNYLNSWIPLLDPVLHTPVATFRRSPFLFSVVCAVTCRYYPEKSHIYALAMHFAKNEAATALIHGFKSVELAQAFIIMAMYSTPVRRWEEDRSWIYVGLAIRIAIDLGLHWTKTGTPKDEMQDREILNKYRLWMICFDTDWAMAAHWGKPSSMKDNHIMRSSTEFYKMSKYNMPYDVHLCAYNMLLRMVAEFHERVYSDPENPSGLNKALDMGAIVLEYDAKCSGLYTEWEGAMAEHRDRFSNDEKCYEFRMILWPYVIEYSRLLILSFGFQQAYERGIDSQGADLVLFNKSLRAATSVIKVMVKEVAPSGYLRYSPDGWFDFASFSAAFLLKLLRPEFVKMLSKEVETEIFSLIGQLVQTYTSSEHAIDDRHTPKLYGRFIDDLLRKHKRDRGMAEDEGEKPKQKSSREGGGRKGKKASIEQIVFSVRPPSPPARPTAPAAPPMSQPVEEMPSAAAQPEAGPSEMHEMPMEGQDAMLDPQASWDSTPGGEHNDMARLRMFNEPFWNTMMMPGFQWNSPQQQPDYMDEQ